MAKLGYTFDTMYYLQ